MVSTPITVRAGATSAMVMLLGGDDMAVTPEAKRLVSALDLHDGEPLAALARRDLGNAQRRVRLRKAGIRAWLEGFAQSQDPAANLLIVPGAGLSPLALDWCVMHPAARAIEIDYSSVDEKRALVRRCADESVTSRMAFVQCDVSDDHALSASLETSGWTATTPSLWVAEGLAYYISHDALCTLVRTALGGNGASRFILEFACPRRELSERAREVTVAYLDALAAMLGGTHLRDVDIRALASDTGTRVERLLHAGEIEQELGWPRHFMSASDTTLRLALLGPSTP